MNHYQNNLSILQSRFPDLADMLPADKKKCEILETETAKDGSITAKLDGQYIHSKYNPAAEAARFADMYKDEKQACFILEGCGFGYAAELLGSQHSDLPIVIVEPEAVLLADALVCRDISGLLKHPYLYIITGSPASSINKVLPLYRDYKFITVKNKTIVGRSEKYFADLEENIKKYTARRDVNNTTLRKFGKLWVKNLFANYAGGKISAGIDIFKSKFSEWPALVLAAGPSLDECTRKIKELAERCLVIAVDSAVNYCLNNSLLPDFVVTVDPQYYNSRHLDGQFTEKTILIAESSTCPRSIRRHNGPVAAGASFFPLGEYFDRIFHFREKLGAGGSVATAAWDFARLCGCREIYMAGLDLGYIDGKTHYKGSHYERNFSAKAFRFNTNDSFAMKLCSDTNSINVKDYLERDLKSDQRLNVYRWWFEQQNINYPELKTIAIDDRSSRISGFRLPEKEYIAGLKPREGKIHKLIAGIMCQKRFPETEKHIHKLAANLEQISNATKKALRLLGKMETASENEYREILKILDNIDNEIMKGPCNEIISFLLQDEIAEVKSMKTTAGPFKQSQMLYSSIKHSADLYRFYIKKYFLY